MKLSLKGRVPFVKLAFPQLVFLTEMQSWVKDKLRLGTWHLECCHALTVLYKSGNRIC